MHPRAGKFNHAAQFSLTPGIKDRALPEGVLVCNFPTGLMEHDDVVTFFHEFGHLVHEILGGAQSWAMFTGVATEWDFVEAPSQLLEEWAWDTDVLQSFATNDAGEPIPADLVARMRRADTFARGAWTRRQLNFTALSYGLHAEAPADLAAFTAAVDERFGPYAPIPDTHQYAGFGHLEGYGSAYYTYLWSLVIAKDLRSAFRTGSWTPSSGAATATRSWRPAARPTPPTWSSASSAGPPRSSPSSLAHRGADRLTTTDRVDRARRARRDARGRASGRCVATGSCGVRQADDGLRVDPDELRVALPDRADLDGLARAGRVDHLVAAEVDGDVTGAPDEVAGLGVLARDRLADVLLGRRRAGQRLDARLLVHVAREARAVERLAGRWRRCGTGCRRTSWRR